MSHIDTLEYIVERRMDDLISQGDLIGAALEVDPSRLVVCTKVEASLDHYDDTIMYRTLLDTKDSERFNVNLRINSSELMNSRAGMEIAYLLENMLNHIRDKFYIIRKD